MKILVDLCQIVQSKINQDWMMIATIPKDQYRLLDKLKKVSDKEARKTLELKVKREGRSHTANSYMWCLVGLMSKKLILPKGDVYIRMIKRYGKFHQLSTKDVALTELIRTWDTKNTSVERTESLCEVTNSFRSKGILWHELDCYEGSSDYDKKEFSVLLQGIISDCEILGINTMTPQEIKGLMDNYEGSTQ